MKKKKKLRRRRKTTGIDLQEALALGVSSFLSSIMRQTLQPIFGEMKKQPKPAVPKMRYAGRGSTVARQTNKTIGLPGESDRRHDPEGAA